MSESISFECSHDPVMFGGTYDLLFTNHNYTAQRVDLSPEAHYEFIPHFTFIV
jgi:hypothetical protein